MVHAIPIILAVLIPLVRFQLSYSCKLFLQVCILLELLSDGAVEGVTVTNCQIY